VSSVIILRPREFIVYSSWNPIVPLGVPRTTTGEDVYDGYYIPKGSVVITNIQSAHSSLSTVTVSLILAVAQCFTMKVHTRNQASSTPVDLLRTGFFETMCLIQKLWPPSGSVEGKLPYFLLNLDLANNALSPQGLPRVAHSVAVHLPDCCLNPPFIRYFNGGGRGRQSHKCCS
jgi:hypothetical protein